MGCRRGELVALKWSDIDFDNKKAFVHKSACKPKNKLITIKDTKSHRSHTVDIPEYMVEMLKRHKQEQLNRRLKLGTAWQGNDWIFTQVNSPIMYPTSPTIIFSKFS